jgi:hypothetical protein
LSGKIALFEAKAIPQRLKIISLCWDSEMTDLSFFLLIGDRLKLSSSSFRKSLTCFSILCPRFFPGSSVKLSKK